MDESSDDQEEQITGRVRKRRIGQLPGPVPKRTKRDVSSIWFLTWNDFPDNWQEKIRRLDGLIRWCCQEETGFSGNKHIQGVCVFNRVWGMTGLRVRCHGCHWEICRNVVSAQKYCSKLKSRTGKVWVHGFRVPLIVKDPLEGKELYAFQNEIIGLVQKDPDERTIYWYWSNKGNIGKSSLCKHLCLKYDAISLGGKVSDAMYAVAKLVDKGKPPSIVVFDVARSEASRLEYVSLEKLKNGCFFSPKYESCMVMLNPPHVIVFANEAPIESRLSDDRWVIKNLDMEMDLPGAAVDNPIRY